MIVIIEKILWIFIMIGIGVFLSKTNLVPYSANKYLINILLKVTTPCMIFQALASRTLTDNTFEMTIQVLIGSILFFVVMDLLGFGIASKFKLKDVKDVAVYAALMAGVNTGFMGFPVSKAIFGDEMFYFMVIQNIALSFFLYLMLPLQFSLGDKDKPSLKKMLITVFNPCMVGTILGVIVLFAGISIPASANVGIKTIGDMTTPLSMIVVGIELAQGDIKKILSSRPLRITSYVAMLGAPAITWLCVVWLPVEPMVKAALVFAAVFPAAVVTVPMASQAGRNSGLAAEGVVLTVLFSLVTIPLWSLLISQYIL